MTGSQALLALLLVGTAFGGSDQPLQNEWSHAGFDWHKPPGELPTRQEDLLRYPRLQFGISYSNGYGERIDSFEGILTKDLVSDHDTTIAFQFTAAELDSLYRKVIAYRLFDFPEPSPKLRQGVMMVPHTTMRLTVSAGAHTKTLQWDTIYLPSVEDQYRWRAIYDLIGTMKRMAEGRPEYRLLPQRKSVYY